MSQTRVAPTQGAGRGLLLDLGGIDLGAVVASTADVERVNPHRHEMRLLDRVIWMAEDETAAVGALDPNPDAFWVRGHFPTRATMPGVLMVEAGAQLACFLWNTRQDVPRLAAFLRIDDAVFRRAVAPTETLLLLCKEVKYNKKRFITEVQGVVENQIAFSARVSGLAMEEHVTKA
ncbi:MAG: hypothetical protein CMJ31_03235 [Phycisphaerae bacterium]|nr:hypothetical protein [Phycisphaerae bacterium]